MRDILLEEAHDYHKDEEFWQKEIKKPRFLYMKAPECSSFSQAHTTPKIRTLEDPEGDEAQHVIWYANTTVRLMVRRLLSLISKGAHVLVENPLLSYLSG